MSARKPYIRPVTAGWWLKKAPYRRYMLREATVLPLTFFSLCLLAGLWALTRGPEAWAGWLDFMAQPLVIGLSLLALAGSLFHAATFFLMMPQVMPVKVRGQLLPAMRVAAAQWAITLGISLFCLLVFVFWEGI